MKSKENKGECGLLVVVTKRLKKACVNCGRGGGEGLIWRWESFTEKHVTKGGKSISKCTFSVMYLLL